MEKLIKGFGILTLFFLILFFGLTSLHAVMGELPSEVPGWATTHGFTAGAETRGTVGCLKGRRYIPLTTSGVKAFATFYHPVYQEETGTITQMIFEFDPPVSIGQARAYAIKVAPIIGTRPPTHTQTIKADPNNPCIGASGGKEERYTKDWIVEFIQSGGKVSRMNVYNDYIR